MIVKKKDVMRILVSVFLLINTLSLWAQDFHIITYLFEGDTLTIHLTPQEGMELIGTMRPEVKEIKSIGISNYITDYENYFNDHIEINDEGRLIGLKHISTDLSLSNSYFRFKMLDFDKDYEYFQIHISAFMDIYPNVQNNIRRPSGAISDETGFQVLKEKFIEFENPVEGYAKSYGLLLFPFVILGLLIYSIWRVIKVVRKI